MSLKFYSNICVLYGVSEYTARTVCVCQVPGLWWPQLAATTLIIITPHQTWTDPPQPFLYSSLFLIIIKIHPRHSSSVPAPSSLSLSLSLT